MKQPNNENKKKIIQKIRTSNTFRKAATSNALLKYLHEATLKGTQLKESIINIEFFRQEANTKKESPQVRVNVYNLRKKLDEYYKNEGKHDKWKAEIKKGQYAVQFVSNNKNHAISITNWKHVISYSALITTIIFLFVKLQPEQKPDIWKSMMTKTSQSKLYIGDVFGMIGTTIIGNKGWTRDYNINSYQDFYNFIKNNPKYRNKLSPSPFSLNNGMAVISTQLFQQFFQTHKRSFLIRFHTNSTLKQIKESNAIYVGTIVNDNKFVTLFNQANKNCQIKNRKIHITGHPDIADTTINLGDPGEIEEYAIVSKYPATEKYDHFVFFSQHDIGVPATVEFFTNTEKLKQFTHKHLKNKNYFTAIYKVSGQDRTNLDLKMELVLSF